MLNYSTDYKSKLDHFIVHFHPTLVTPLRVYVVGLLQERTSVL